MSKGSLDTSGKSFSCVVLTGKENYQVWSFTMREHLKTVNLINYVCDQEITIAIAERAGKEEITEHKIEIEDAGQKAQQAKSMLLSNISPEEIAKITHCQSAKEIWKYFKQAYGSKSSNIKLELMNELSCTKFSSAKEVSDGLNKILATKGKLQNLNVTIDDVTILDLILKALPSSFANFLANWQMIDGDQQTLERLITKLNEKSKEITDQEEINQIAMRANINYSRPNPRFIGAKPNFVRRQFAPNRFYRPQQNFFQNNAKPGLTQKSSNPNHNFGGAGVNKQPNQPNRPDSDLCNYCKHPGHWKSDCRKLKYKLAQDKNDIQIAYQANTNLSLNLSSTTSSLDTNQTTWIIDSGCSSHMSPNKQLFQDLVVPPTKIDVKIGDGTLLRVAGVGNIVTIYGTLRAYYVPKLRSNLFSVPAALKSNHKITFKQSVITLEHEGQIITYGHVRDGLCLINLPPSQPIALTAATIEDWHKRLAHTPKEVIEKMVKTNAVNGIDFTMRDNLECIDCKLNKCRKASHPTRTTVKASKPGQVIHADLIGPIKPEGVRGEKYVLVCKDEFSKMILTACLKSKTQTVGTLKTILSKIELQTGNRVLKFSSDNGSEFVNFEFKTFLEQRGIDHFCSSPYIHEQNGLIERENQTILSRARATLNSSKLFQSLWPEAVGVVTYVTNRVTRSNSEITPYEIWYNKKPNLENLKIFGQQASVMKNEQRGKFDPRGSVMNFVGYTEYFNTYRFVDLKTMSFITTCNAVFLKEVGPIKTEQQNCPRDFNQVESQDHIKSFDFTIEENIDRDIENERLRKENERKMIKEAREELEANIESNDREFLNDMEKVLIEEDSKILSELEIALKGLRDAQSPIPAEFIVDEVVNEPPFSVEGLMSDEEITCNSNKRSKIDNQTEEIGDKTIRPKFARAKSDEKINERSKRANTRIDYRKLLKGDVSLRADLAICDNPPLNYKEACQREDANEWIEAFNNEMSSLISNQVFELVQKEEAANIVGCRWVLTYKTMPDGGIKPKARLVAKGYAQVHGIDYSSTFSPVVDMNSVRLIFALIASKNLFFLQFDIKTAFLNGNLDEEIFMNTPEGFEDPNGKIWRLKKSLYGLKQSPRKWNERFTEELEKLNFNQVSDSCIFIKKNPFVIMAVYVDDAIICSEDITQAKKIITQLEKKFEIHLILNNKFLGFEYKRLEDGSIFIHQSQYIEKILKRFNMHDCTTAPTPFECGQAVNSNNIDDENFEFREAVGALQFAASQTRPDIAFAVNYLSRQVLKPENMHQQILKRVFRYLRGSTNLGLKYSNKFENNLEAFSDADYAGDSQTYKSTSGQLVLYNNAPIAWKSKLQRINVTSTTEAEYLALASTTKTVLSLKNLLNEFESPTTEPVNVFCDNKSTVAIATNDASAQRTRHLGAQLYFTKDQHKRKNIKVNWISSKDQLADMLTKPLNREKFSININKIMVLMLCLVSCCLVNAQEPKLKNEIEFVQVNPVVWLAMNKNVNIGLNTHRFTIKLPKYCQEINDKKQQVKTGMIYKMLEKAEISCLNMLKEVYFPALGQLEGYKFTEKRIKRASEIEELEKISNEPIREAAGGWEAAGASIPLIGEFIKTIVQYNKEESAYNTVWKHDKDLKRVIKAIIDLNKQFVLQNSVNNNASETLKVLNNSTNTLFSQLDLLEKVSPEISEVISKYTVSIYRDSEFLKDIKFDFERSEIKVETLLKLGAHDNQTIKDTLKNGYIKGKPAKMLNFHINMKKNEFYFVYAYPIVDPNSFLFETVNLREHITNRTYRIFPETLYAIYNETANCSKLIEKPAEHLDIFGIKCKQQNSHFKLPEILYNYIEIPKEIRWLEPQIVKKYTELYIQCYGLNITTEGTVTQSCPKYPFVVPMNFDYQIDDWEHKFEYSESSSQAQKLNIQDIEEIEQVFPWSTTFESIQNRIQYLDDDNKNIKQISERESDNTWTENIGTNIWSIVKYGPLFVGGLSSLTLIAGIMLLYCYLNTRQDPLVGLVKTSLMASLINDNQNHDNDKEGDQPNINIEINNQVFHYPNLANESVIKQHAKKGEEVDKGSIEETWEKGDLDKELIEEAFKNLDDISFRSLPIINEEETIID